MDQKTTRRSALRTGTLTALGIGLMGAAATGAGRVPAAPIAEIDQAEALLLELRDVMLRLDDRHAGDVGHVLELLARAAELREPAFSEGLAEIEEHIGPGNRVMDRIDRDIAARKRAAVAHAAVVARYARAYHAGGADAGTAIRAELAEAYGEDRGDALGWAAFGLYLRERHHDGDGCAYPACYGD